MASPNGVTHLPAAPQAAAADQQQATSASGLSGAVLAVQSSTEQPNTSMVLVKVKQSAIYRADKFADAEPCSAKPVASYNGVVFYELCQRDTDGEHIHSSTRVQAFASETAPLKPGDISVAETALNLSDPLFSASHAATDDAYPPLNPASEAEFTISHNVVSLHHKPSSHPCFSPSQRVMTSEGSMTLDCQVTEMASTSVHQHRLSIVKNVAKDAALNSLIPEQAYMATREFDWLSPQEQTELDQLAAQAATSSIRFAPASAPSTDSSIQQQDKRD